jgi:hypothetical protein
MQVRYVVGCLLATLLLAACGSSGDKGGSTPAGPQRLDVTARDFALRISGSPALRPGPVSITARNVGKQAHGMVLVKLNDGVAPNALIDALTNKPGDVPGMLTYVGGTTTLPTGGSWQATTSFDQGTYAMLDVGVAKGGRLNFTRKGEVQSFSVSGKPVTAAATARPTATFKLYDYGIQGPKSIPQSGRIRVQNTGNDDHQLVVLPVASAAEGKRILQAFKTGTTTPTAGRPIEVLAPTSASTSTTVSYRLAKGAYIAYCTFRTAASGGKIHAGLGMVAAFAVQ